MYAMSSHRRAVRAGVAALAVISVVALSACSSSKKSNPVGSGASTTTGTTAAASGIDVATAKANVTAAAAAPASFTDPGPAFGASKAKGKKVWYISYSQQSPALVVWANAMQEALTKYGVGVTVFDGKGTQTEFQRGMEQAIAAKADAIFLLGIDPASLSAQVAQAKSAGIPVMIGSNGVESIPTDAGVVASVSLNHEQVGKDLASWMVADAGKPFHAVITTHPGVIGLDPLVNSVQSTLASLCSACKLKIESVPFTQLATLPQIAQNDYQKDSSVKYILSVYDFELLSLVTGITQASAADKVGLGSFNATEAVMKQLGSTAIKADVGNPNAWFGYAEADQILRVLTGTAPVADENVPLRLFTKDNIGDIDISKGEGTWYGNADFVAGYAKLWGAPAS